MTRFHCPWCITCPGQFEWLFDARGAFRETVWQRWLNEDPLTLVRNDPKSFRPGQRIYLDGPRHDDYLANIGAQKMADILQSRSVPCVFYEPPGRHRDRLQERLQRGLAWTFPRPTKDL